MIQETLQDYCFERADYFTSRLMQEKATWLQSKHFDYDPLQQMVTDVSKTISCPLKADQGQRIQCTDVVPNGLKGNAKCWLRQLFVLRSFHVTFIVNCIQLPQTEMAEFGSIAVSSKTKHALPASSGALTWESRVKGDRMHCRPDLRSLTEGATALH